MDRTYSSHAYLQRLPPELRNRIYSLVAAEHSQLHFVDRKLDSNTPAAFAEAGLNMIGLHPLSQTCKQFLLEFQPVYVHSVLGVMHEPDWISRVVLHAGNFELTALSRCIRTIQRTALLNQKLKDKPIYICCHFDQDAWESLINFWENPLDTDFHSAADGASVLPFRYTCYDADFKRRPRKGIKRKYGPMTPGFRKRLMGRIEQTSKEAKWFQGEKRKILARIRNAISCEHRDLQSAHYQARREREEGAIEARAIERLKAAGWTLIPPSEHGDGHVR